MKISVYSLSCADKNPAEVIKLAEKYGCGGVEWWCREKGHIDVNNLPKSAEDVAKIMKDSQLETAGIAPYFKYNETRDEIAKIFNVAKILNTGKVRCHSYPFPGESSVAELMERQIRWLEKEVLPATEEFDVQLNIEQHHNMICCTPNACLQMVAKFPPERIGIIYDPGNSLFEGFTKTGYALSVMGGHINHVHVKSARYVQEGGSVPAGRKYPMEFGTLEKGDLNWEEIIKQLDGIGYKGYLSLEALDGRESETKLKEDIPFLQKILKGIK
ncbi:MAG: sugar phosphate isomerase/epimerase [Candidatus Omnitrophica bacterium]|nr:sugar phosphate isomerase/epimerase [Candidatus Omnitrophota bacterium]